MVLLAFENVSKSYGSTPALEHINFEIEAEKLSAYLVQMALEKQP